MNINISYYRNFTDSNNVKNTNNINKFRTEKFNGASSFICISYKYDETSGISGKIRVFRNGNKPVSFGCFGIEHTLNETLSIKNLTDAFSDTDLKPYINGFPIKYSRKDFISDFTDNLSGLCDDEKDFVMRKFDFNITENGDIIGFPKKDFDEADIPENLKETTEKAKNIVDSFMYKNSFILEHSDKKAETVLNETGKVFPEFYTIVGKKQQRLGTIDYHTFDDIKLCLKNPKIKEINEKDARVLILSALFHDFTKREGVSDYSHPQTGAEISGEIMKKVPITQDEKERIHNLIEYSHWGSGCRNDDDLAVKFRHPGDFNLAYIFADADSASAGFFGISCSDRRKDYIQKQIDTINRNAMPLFPDNLPSKTKNLETATNGVKYMDFSSSDNDISKYGFKKGTKAGDLRFMFSCAYDFDALCEKTVAGENMCLNANYINMLNIKDNYGVILSGYNSNIVLTSYEPYDTKKYNIEDYKNITGLTGKTALERKTVPELLRNKLNINEEEYLKLYEKIGNLSDIDDIGNVDLTCGKKLTAEEIKRAVAEIQDYTAEKNVMLFNSKIEAFIVPKQDLLSEKTSEKINKITELSRKQNIPLIVV